MARGAVAALAFAGFGALQQPSWLDAFHAADSARARVEVLYGAGDLPGALQEALTGLRAHADDTVLLRRACQLALALRMPDVATSAAARLAANLPHIDAADRAAKDWWSNESSTLSREAADLAARERELDADVARARVVSLAGIGAVLAGLVALARAR